MNYLFLENNKYKFHCLLLQLAGIYNLKLDNHYQKLQTSQRRSLNYIVSTMAIRLQTEVHDFFAAEICRLLLATREWGNKGIVC